MKIESWRLYFPVATALGGAGLGLWGLQLGGWGAGGILPAQHGAFMIFGVMGTAVQGFLFTAYAKQNDAPLPGPAFLGGIGLLQVAASASFLFGGSDFGWTLLRSAPWIGTLLWALSVAAPSLRRRWDDTTAAVPVVLGASLCGVILKNNDVGVHLFLIPTALAVLDRVLPFFSSKVVPGYAGKRLPGFWGPLLLLSLLKLFVPVASLVGLALLGRQVWGWKPWPAAKIPMIAVIYVGLLWIGGAWLAEGLGASRSLVLHALGVGGMGSLFLGISMRVARGHSGMPVVLGRTGLGILLLAQLAAVVRLLAPVEGNSVLYVASAVLLGMAFLVWLLRFGPIAAGR